MSLEWRRLFTREDVPRRGIRLIRLWERYGEDQSRPETMAHGNRASHGNLSPSPLAPDARLTTRLMILPPRAESEDLAFCGRSLLWRAVTDLPLFAF